MKIYLVMIIFEVYCSLMFFITEQNAIHAVIIKIEIERYLMKKY